jgi:glucuronokinase
MLAVELPELSARGSVTASGEGRVTPESGLIRAVVARFARQFAPAAASADVAWETTIPRSVGLGGSSALVIAVTRALCALCGVSLELMALADFAHAVERVDLGIPGGRQDQVMQAHGGLVFMDFAGSRVRCDSLDPDLLPPYIVAWRPQAAEDSGIAHAGLRERYEAGEPVVVNAMDTLTQHARDARAALLAGDAAAFARCVDATFDVRRRILELDPRHVEMVEAARAAGAAANYTGSGGAIVAVCASEAHRERVARVLEVASCEVLRVI